MQYRFLLQIARIENFIVGKWIEMFLVLKTYSEIIYCSYEIPNKKEAVACQSNRPFSYSQKGPGSIKDKVKVQCFCNTLPTT